MSKRDVYYSFIVENNNIKYLIGTMIIKPDKGDIMFVPSEKTYLKDDEFYNKIIEHISWHNSGRLHIKFRNEKKKKIIEENRINFDKIKRQKLFSILIQDFTKLPQYTRKINKLDIVIKKIRKGKIALRCNIFSGKYFIESVKNNDGYFNLERLRESLIYTNMRSIRYGEKNRQVVLQFILLYYNDKNWKQKTNTLLIISYDEKYV